MCKTETRHCTQGMPDWHIYAIAYAGKSHPAYAAECYLPIRQLLWSAPVVRALYADTHNRQVAPSRWKREAKCMHGGWCNNYQQQRMASRRLSESESARVWYALTQSAGGARRAKARGRALRSEISQRSKMGTKNGRKQNACLKQF